MRADADFFQHRRDDAFLVFEQRGEQVNRTQLGIAMLGGELVRALDGFLRFDGEFVPTDGHGEPLLSFCHSERSGRICAIVLTAKCMDPSLRSG